ncbi:hypothetical protein D9M71_791310 [compost metagenome]
MADSVGSQVAVGHHGGRLGGLPGFDDFAAQLTGSRVVTKNARIDMQQFHVGSPGEDRRQGDLMETILQTKPIAD